MADDKRYKVTTMGVDHELWARVNQVILGENAAVVLTTLLDGLSMILLEAKIVDSVEHARAHLAVMLVSPDTGPVGALKPLFEEELRKLGG